MNALKIGMTLALIFLAPFASAACGYCEGYDVLKKATAKVAPPGELDIQTHEQSNVVLLADKLLGQILIEDPKLGSQAIEYFTKSLARAAAYDVGNELVGNYWTKVSSRKVDIEKNLKSLVAKKEIQAKDAERLRTAIATHEGIIKEGN